MKVPQFLCLFICLLICHVKSEETSTKHEKDNKITSEVHHQDSGNIIKTIETEHVIGIDAKIQTKPAEEGGTATTNKILDSIFNIPIVTLRAVSDLVQNIAGNLQAAGAGTYFQKTSKVVVTPTPSNEKATESSS